MILLKSISEISGGTAPNGFKAGGNFSSAAGSAGILMTFSAFHSPLLSSKYQWKIEAERSAVEITTPTYPQVA